MTENSTDVRADVSVIICAYTEERWPDLVAAIESIERQRQPARELLLVIDHNPALLGRVRAAFPTVTSVENSEPQGLSGARNSGIAHASGSLIAFLDDDATAEPDWLERLCRCCADERVLGAGGTVEPAWLDTQPAWFPREFHWVVGCTYLCPPAQPVVVRNPFGGCTCFRREIFEGVGGFRSEIGRTKQQLLGCEETELCIRARQHWPEKCFLYEPRARIHHRIPPQRGTWRYFRSRCYGEGLSKARVARYVGAKDGLASERAYTLRLLPQGVLRGLCDGLLRLDPAGFARAGAIVGGLFLTTLGYARGMFSRIQREDSESEEAVAVPTPLESEAQQKGLG
ncbi:MAG TPA: glycosyltransferase [Ktedonobacterales bacterium]|jgi:GT2 family glycosyltransferase